jgi:methylisocitrate lyase
MDEGAVMTRAADLRKLLADEDVLVAGAAYDVVSARVTEASGFKAIAVGGLMLEAVLLGAPDLGLLTLTELANHVRHMARAVEIPLIVDADTGFGSVMNVTRTVVELEAAGVAGMHIEDQLDPKRCPYVAGRRLVSREEAVGRIRAACAARSDPDFVIIARCDGDAVSIEELIARSNRFLEAGADLVIPMIMEVDGRDFEELSVDEQRDVHARVCDAVDGPVACPQLPAGQTLGDVRAYGYDLLFLGMHNLAASVEAQFAVWEAFRRDGSVQAYFDAHPLRIAQGTGRRNTRALLDFLKLDEWLAIERAYTPEGES